jgi:CheY-like chemotaxis protein
MDINLGQGMNGYQLTDHIRKMTKLPTIVALSGGEVDQALAK